MNPDWEANTVQLREWLRGGAVSTSLLLRELRLWHVHFSDYDVSETDERHHSRLALVLIGNDAWFAAAMGISSLLILAVTFASRARR